MQCVLSTVVPVTNDRCGIPSQQIAHCVPVGLLLYDQLIGQERPNRFVRSHTIVSCPKFAGRAKMVSIVIVIYERMPDRDIIPKYVRTGKLLLVLQYVRVYYVVESLALVLRMINFPMPAVPYTALYYVLRIENR